MAIITLALPAAQLVRVGIEALRGVRQPHAIEQAQRFGARRAAVQPRRRRSGSATCAPTVCSG
jgi:hypothetical protein